MAVTVYRSTDASAPVLTGAVGALNALLQACLVDGYGAKPALGWTREFVDGPNYTSAYKSGAGSTARYLRVDDGAPGTGAAKEAYVNAYEAMTDIDTGTGWGSLVYARKSATADAVARGWILIGTSKIFHLMMFNGDTAGNASMLTFGDIYSYVSDDLYRAILLGRGTENSASWAVDGFSLLTSALGTTSVGNYICRAYTGTGGAIAIGKHTNFVESNATVLGTAGGAYPCPIGGGLQMTPVFLHEPTVTRGTLPGIWGVLHAKPLTLGDTLTGVEGLSGRLFEVVNTGSTGQFLIEVSDTWVEN